MQHAPVAEPEQYRCLFGLTPTFNAPRNCFMFETALLETPLHAADPALHRLIQQHLDSVKQMSISSYPNLCNNRYAVLCLMAVRP